ncbi:hypothetical protein ACIQ6V_18025 [Streptomyces sp. NPDC096198]|uniref:hypothetical protein n=1 Tax=Streptomyces sp. NPDC096198 TaxID=3366080 RepID=UPI00381BF55D
MITIEVILGRWQATVLVRDNDPSEPPLLAGGYVRAEHGRCLLVVDHLAARWDVRFLGENTRAIYFTLVDSAGGVR